jgi:hypothetical protein
MERLLKNQQIPLVQVIDPISGQQYYAPESAIYTTSTDSNPVILKNITVDQATSSSYLSETSLISLTPQHPLPIDAPTGSFAVSSSRPPIPYFWDGDVWRALYEIP